MEGMTPMDHEATTVNRMNELPDRTKEFLSKLDDRDIDNLEGVMTLWATLQTLGRVGKWAAISVLAIIVGIVSLYENIVKIVFWFHK